MAERGHPDSIAGRIATGVAIVLGATATAGAVAAAVVVGIFARTVITPPTKREEDVRILAHDDATITLSATLDSLTPGRYSLWFRRDTGHARVGEILSHTPTSVTRQLLGVQLGELPGATRGRFSGWYYLSPADLDIDFENVEVATELGPAPAWRVPAARPSARWLIGVHGRAVRRQEAIRAVPVFREAGYESSAHLLPQ